MRTKYFDKRHAKYKPIYVGFDTTPAPTAGNNIYSVKLTSYRSKKRYTHITSQDRSPGDNWSAAIHHMSLSVLVIVDFEGKKH